MFKFLNPILLLCLPLFVLAQKDTMYFKETMRVASLAESDRYRLPAIPEGDLYKVVEYYKEGMLLSEAYTTSPDSFIWTGKYTSYFKNGHKMEEGKYINGYQVGNWKRYKEDGKLWLLSFYNPVSDTTEILRSFYPSGKMKRIEYHVKEKDTTGICYDGEGRQIPFTPFQQMPVFKGNVNEFLGKNIRFPDEALELGYDGKVLVRFLVMNDGSVKEIRVINPSIHPSLMKEAIRVVKQMNGRWLPGKEDDEVTNVHYTLPVVFRIE